MKLLRVLMVAAVLGLPGLMISGPLQQLVPGSVVLAQAQPENAPAVEVHVEKHVWFLDPVLLAIAGGVILLVILALAMSGRGGGTTIIREER